MKRVLALLLLAVMIVGLFGCGKKEAQQAAVTEAASALVTARSILPPRSVSVLAVTVTPSSVLWRPSVTICMPPPLHSPTRMTILSL